METLSTSDRDLWRMFRRTAEQVSAAIERDLMAASQLSGADHGILSRLAEAETGSMRQQQLCELMRWDRTRLSHHLTRMETRGLLKRSKLKSGGRLVTLTPHGDQARKAAEPVHADAVMRRFISKLTAGQRKMIVSFAGSLADATT